MFNILRRMIPNRVRRSYALKFGIVLLIIGVSVGMIGLLATEAIGAQVQDDANEEFATLAEQEAQSLQAWSESNEQRVRTLVRNPELRSLSTTQLRQYTQAPDRAHAIHVVDTGDGTITASTDRGVEGEGIDVLSMPDSDRLLEELGPFSVYRSEPYRLDGGEGSPVVTYAQTTGDGAVGVVYTVELQQYTETFNSYGDDRSTTLVLDSRDRVVFDDARYGTEGDNFLSEYGASSALDDENGVSGAHTVAGNNRADALSEYGFPEEEYVVGYAPVDGTDFTVLVHQPTADAYGFVTTVQRFGFAATATAMILITAIGAVLGRNTALSINRLTDRAALMEDGDLDVDLATERIDEIGQLYLAFDGMRLSLREQIQMAQRAREEAEQERRRIEEMNEDLTKTANEYADVMQAAAAGDLTARMDPAATQTDAMWEVADEFNSMIEELEQTIAQLNQFASEVSAASERVTASSEAVRSSSERVASSVQQISAGADRQNDSLQDVKTAISDLSSTTRSIATSSNEVADIAEKTARTGAEGQEAAQEVVAGIGQIEAESERAVEQIEELGEEVAQIDELIDQIQEIADQTNMLALSANLEAVRSPSDEQDDGFDKVAQEVKELSTDAKSAAEEIDTRLGRIRTQTEQSIDAVEKTSARIEDASSSVQNAAEALESIATYADETSSGVQEISTATQQQMISTREVEQRISEVASISQETASEASTVVAATEEQTNALTEVSGSMSDLATRATQLADALDRFDADGDAEPGGPIDVL